VTDSATFTTPEAGNEDLGDLLLQVLPPDGSTIGNLSAGLTDHVPLSEQDLHFEGINA